MILVALASLLRVSELASNNFSSIVFRDSSVSLLRPRKAQHSGPLQTITLAKFGDESGCPVTAMYTYREKTTSLRTLSNKSFFIGISPPPYVDVSGNNISRWVKEFLKSAGVDTSIFSAHSTRDAAATSR